MTTEQTRVDVLAALGGHRANSWVWLSQRRKIVEDDLPSGPGEIDPEKAVKTVVINRYEQSLGYDKEGGTKPPAIICIEEPVMGIILAAVTELLAADREYDEANKNLGKRGASDFGYSRLIAAVQRRSAALQAFAPQREDK